MVTIPPPLHIQCFRSSYSAVILAISSLIMTNTTSHEVSSARGRGVAVDLVLAFHIFNTTFVEVEVQTLYIFL